MRRFRPSPALVVSIVALIVALGGTSYAAFLVPQNSVGTKQLKNGAVTGAKIARGAVTGDKVNLGTFGTVPAAANASHASTADHATNAYHAATADHATNADYATNAGELGGQPSSVYQSRVSGSCTNDTAIAEINTAGTVRCATGVHEMFSNESSSQVPSSTNWHAGPFTLSWDCTGAHFGSVYDNEAVLDIYVLGGGWTDDWWTGVTDDSGPVTMFATGAPFTINGTADRKNTDAVSPNHNSRQFGTLLLTSGGTFIKVDYVQSIFEDSAGNQDCYFRGTWTQAS